MDAKKALKIKTGVVKRSLKDLESYTKEAAMQRAKVDDLVAKKAGEAEVKRAKAMLQETLDVIPSCERNL